MKIGIDIGGSHIATGIVLNNGKLLAKETRDIDVSSIKEVERVETIIVDTIQNEIKTLLNRYDYTINDITRIGIAVPGSPTDTSIRNVVNLHIKEFNLAKELSEIYNINSETVERVDKCIKNQIEIKLANDGKCAGVAEKEYGALKGYDDCLFLCMGTGVGSAVFLGGKLLKAKQNPGFEFGHMIIDKDGTLCNCGKKGCFETYASMKRFKVRAIEELDLPKDVQSEEVQNFIRKNSHKTKVNKFIDKYLENVAIGVSNLINIFEPEAICFGGSFSYYDDVFLEPLAEKLKKYVFNKNTKVTLISAKLKNDAGIIGATEI